MRTKKTAIRNLQYGDIVTDCTLTSRKIVFDVVPARMRNYMIVVYTDGSRSSGHMLDNREVVVEEEE